jgi:dihydroflavonol-4-reductase
MLGPGDHKFRSTSNVLRVLRRKLPFIFSGSIHYADVRDVADAMVRAMLLPEPRQIYHTPGTVQSLDDFFGLVASEAKLPRTWKVLPTALVGAVARLAELLGIKSRVVPNPVLIEMASHHWELASRYAEPDLGYKARPAQETIADTVQWLRLNHPELRGH